MRERTSVFWILDKDILQNIVLESNSLAEICRKIDISSSGSQNKVLKKALYERGITFSHIKLGLGSNAGKPCRHTPVPLEQVLVENSNYDRGKIKIRLIKELGWEYKCQKCGLKDEWQNEKLSLHLDHVNGVNNDNRKKNLRFLCPNCHSQTETFSGRKHKVIRKCPKCNEDFSKGSSECYKCKAKDVYFKNLELTDRPNYQTLIKQTAEIGFVATGKIYNVSDNAIRKWISKYEKYGVID